METISSAHDDVIAIDELHEYRRIDAIWYHVALAPLPSERGKGWDVVHRKPVVELCRDEIIERGGRRFYYGAKRQLGSKEVRRLPISS